MHICSWTLWFYLAKVFVSNWNSCAGGCGEAAPAPPPCAAAVFEDTSVAAAKGVTCQDSVCKLAGYCRVGLLYDAVQGLGQVPRPRHAEQRRCRHSRCHSFGDHRRCRQRSGRGHAPICAAKAPIRLYISPVQGPSGTWKGTCAPIGGSCRCSCRILHGAAD